MQIEDFLAYAIEQEPSLLAALAIADIPAVDDDEADRFRQRAKAAEERRDAKALVAKVVHLIA